ncbi:TPA: type I glyceraldehyde-3-phosphate dehydrogenase [Candidatus Micrarchaeota archaeon]|nr:type I glyceraldehyde-3-phosphate dehydrogenase [Candidatus Micrarchaeota archaeon]
MKKIAINGFGRIGRLFLRAAFKNPVFFKNHEVVAVNDLTDSATLGHLLKYDSVHGIFPEQVTASEKMIFAGGHEIQVLSEKEPFKLPWKDMGVDLVVESTGFFTKSGAEGHLQAGAKKVILSAPGTCQATLVMGVNDDTYDKAKHNVVSMASCTTNCLAPIAYILEKEFGIDKAFMSTAHSYTNDQKLLDFPHKDLRRARNAATNIIPTSTGAAKAIGEVIPSLKGKMDGIALRVPTPDGSINNVVAVLNRPASKEEVNAVMKEYADGKKGRMKGILKYETDPIVLTDIVGNPHSSIFDSQLTNCMGNLCSTFSWYDNEWGFSMRLVECTQMMLK